MGRGRTVASSVALAVLIALTGACGSSAGSKSAPKGSTAAHARAVATTRAKKAARHRRVVAHRRAVQRRRARAALVSRRRARRAHAVKLAALRSTPESDLTAITQSVNQINAAFGRSVRRGIARAAAVNYWASTGVYTRRQCRAFAANEGEGLVAEMLVLHPETLTATPGWVDTSVGRTPAGRIYAIGVDEIQTFVPTGEQRVLAQQLRATVGRDRRARFFFRCE